MKKAILLLAAAVSAVSLYAAPFECNGNFVKINQKENVPDGWYKNGKIKDGKFEMVKDKDGKNVLHLVVTAQNTYVALYTGKTCPLKVGDKVTVKMVAKGAYKNFELGLYYYSKKANIGGGDSSFLLNSPNAYKEYTGTFIVKDNTKTLVNGRAMLCVRHPADLWIKSVSFDVTPAAAAPAKK